MAASKTSGGGTKQGGGRTGSGSSRVDQRQGPPKVVPKIPSGGSSTGKK